MGNKHTLYTNFISAALAALFCYAAMSKLLHYEQSQQEMLNQVFPRSWALVLTWLVPSAELIVMVLLLINCTQQIGLWSAALLLFEFSIYIAVMMTGVFGRVPCSCGGILKNMGFGTHLIFNLFFVLAACSGIAGVKGRKINKWFHFKERRRRKVG